MAKTVKISDALYQLAKSEAETMHRSLPMQIEYWCTIASKIEKAGVPVTMLAEIAKSKPAAADAVRVYELLQAWLRTPDVRALEAFRHRLASTGLSVYESDPAHPGLVIAVHPDGTREVGEFTPAGFKPMKGKRRRPATAGR
jgi:hypothetical protein